MKHVQSAFTYICSPQLQERSTEIEIIYSIFTPQFLWQLDDQCDVHNLQKVFIDCVCISLGLF